MAFYGQPIDPGGGYFVQQQYPFVPEVAPDPVVEVAQQNPWVEYLCSGTLSLPQTTPVPQYTSSTKKEWAKEEAHGLRYNYVSVETLKEPMPQMCLDWYGIQELDLTRVDGIDAPSTRHDSVLYPLCSERDVEMYFAAYVLKYLRLIIGDRMTFPTEVTYNHFISYVKHSDLSIRADMVVKRGTQALAIIEFKLGRLDAVAHGFSKSGYMNTPDLLSTVQKQTIGELAGCATRFLMITTSIFANSDTEGTAAERIVNTRS